MATQQRPSSRKAKFSTTPTEQVETGLEIALAEGTGDGGLAVKAPKNEDTGRDEPQEPELPVTGGPVLENGSGGVEPGVAAPDHLHDGGHQHRHHDNGDHQHRHHDNGDHQHRHHDDGDHQHRHHDDGDHHHRHLGDGYWGLIEEKLVSLGLTEKELAYLRPTSVVTNVGDPYSPNPESDERLRGGYEALVKTTIQRPQMRQIEKTDFIKEISYKNETIEVPKTSIEMDRIVHKDQIIVLRKVAKKIPKTFYRVVEEVREVTEMVDVVEYKDVHWIEEVPRYVIKKEPKTISVPVLKNVEKTRTVEVPTGKFFN